MSHSIAGNGKLIGDGRAIDIRLPVTIQKFNSATIVESKYVCPALANEM